MSAPRIRWSRRSRRETMKVIRVAEKRRELFTRSRGRWYWRLLGRVAPRFRARCDELADERFYGRERVVLSFFRRLLAMGKPPRTKRAPAVTREREKADAILAELKKARSS
ncbi:MAG TPA: hypothetical protein P5298_15060 [Spirochaetia bacterium]|nr:hypothetical protein [Spirochaetia bacterium]